MTALLEIRGLVKDFGGLRALSGLSLTLREGEILGLIGPNGAGKTTVFNCLNGLHPPTAGEVLFRGQSLLGLKPSQVAARGLARTFQNIRLFARMSALENVLAGAHCRSRAGVFGAVLRTRRALAEEEHLVARAYEILRFLGIESKAEEWAANLSYGDQRRLEMARALATAPRCLLLDEPAAGMNPSESRALMDLIRRIRERGVTVVLIEHDMRVVMGVSDRVAVLDHGEKIAEGTPAEVQRDPAVIAAYLGGSPGGPARGGRLSPSQEEAGGTAADA